MMHHAACDGLAACEIWGDVWTLYHGGRLPPFREGGIRSRAPTVATAPAPASPSWWQSLRDFAALLPQPLRSPAHRRPATAGGDPYATLVVAEAVRHAATPAACHVVTQSRAGRPRDRASGAGESIKECACPPPVVYQRERGPAKRVAVASKETYTSRRTATLLY